MSKTYFENFPTITFNSLIVKNITLKSSFLSDIFKAKTTFFPYMIVDGIRPDTIAHRYYGSSDYEWVVFFSNNIIDPYYQWPLTSTNFARYIVNKYGAVQNAFNTINYYMYNVTVNPSDINFQYYENYQMSVASYNNLSPSEQGFWIPVTAYQDEFNINESKKNILLLDKLYLNQLEREISSIMKQ